MRFIKGTLATIIQFVIYIVVLLVLIFILLVLLSKLGIVNMDKYYKPVLYFLNIDKKNNIPDQPIGTGLEDQRLLKKQQTLQLLQKKLQTQQQNIDQEKQKLQANMALYKEKYNQLLQQEKSWQLLQDNLKKTEHSIEKLAQYLEGMPPKNAVNILLKMSEALTVQVLNQVNEDAKKAGKISIVSYWLSLMPDQKAADLSSRMVEFQS